MTKHFTARISGPEDKRKRQLAYLEALEAIDPKMLAIIPGKYRTESISCRACGHELVMDKEKKTDANIAVEIMKDALRDEFDTAILVSGDTDQCPTIRAVRELWPEKRVVVAFPPRRHADGLADVAHASFDIGEARFRQNQFLTRFKANGRIHEKPTSWL